MEDLTTTQGIYGHKPSRVPSSARPIACRATLFTLYISSLMPGSVFVLVLASAWPCPPLLCPALHLLPLLAVLGLALLVLVVA